MDYFYYLAPKFSVDFNASNFKAAYIFLKFVSVILCCNSYFSLIALDVFFLRLYQILTVLLWSILIL